jgi:PTS system N-acetylgalactosamine-specific IIA component
MSSPRAIIIGHGDFAFGLVSAVEKITGRGGVLISLTNRDQSLPQCEDMLRQRLMESGVRVVFTDLAAGSASMAARKTLRDNPQALLVAGANLPMLLDFVMSTDPDPVAAARTAAEKGKGAITMHGGQP